MSETQAVQWTGDNYQDIRDFARRADGFSAVVYRDGDGAVVQTPEGNVVATAGNWIVRDDAGEYRVTEEP